MFPLQCNRRTLLNSLRRGSFVRNWLTTYVACPPLVRNYSLPVYHCFIIIHRPVSWFIIIICPSYHWFLVIQCPVYHWFLISCLVCHWSLFFSPVYHLVLILLSYLPFSSHSCLPFGFNLLFCLPFVYKNLIVNKSTHHDEINFEDESRVRMMLNSF